MGTIRKIIYASFISVLIISSCAKKEEFNNNDQHVGKNSRIIYFPSVTIKGDRLIILDVGASFTEPGVTAVLNNEPVTFTTTGSVNTASPGVYVLEYGAANQEGYTASDWRTVVIIGNDVAANDFSGTYNRAVTNVNSTWTKTANGVYTVENPGGAGVGAGLEVIAVNYQGNKIAIPRQISPDFGEVSSGNETYTPTPLPAKYSWSFFAGGYGTQLRTFIKQ